MALSAAQELVKSFNANLAKQDLVIKNINPTNEEDKILALEVAMRGKSETDYRLIYRDLCELADKETDIDKRDELDMLAIAIMGLGAERHGIDWS